MKKKLVSFGMVVLLVFVGGQFAQAVEDSKAKLGGGMAATFVGAPNEYRSKLRASAGGGDFSCGVNGFKVWASYYHSRLTHNATAMNGWGGYVRDKQKAGRRAYVTCNATLTGNTGWWNIY